MNKAVPFSLTHLPMPKHKEVPTLKTLSVRSVGAYVINLAPKIVSELKGDAKKIAQRFQAHINHLNAILELHVPWNVYDLVAVEVLNAIKTSIDKKERGYYMTASMTQYLTEMNVTVNLAEVVLNRKLKCLDFLRWPAIIRHIFYQNLTKMTGLEVLNIGSCAFNYDTRIVDGLHEMSNLRSICLCFDCNDQMVEAIAKTCPRIQIVDVTSSRSVTDRSVRHLLKCTLLQELHLHRTSVSVEGHAQLISQLPRLQTIGRCDELPRILKVLQPNRYVNFKKIDTRDVTVDILRLLTEFFPAIECLSLLFDLQSPDLTELTQFKCLKQVKLVRVSWFTQCLPIFFVKSGHQLLHLHLEHSESLPLHSLTLIGNHCPNLSSLVVYNCDFFTDYRSLTHLHSKSFSKLNRLFWVVDHSCAILLELILSHSIDIESIHLGSSSGIQHLNIVNVLRVNPMLSLKELRVLYSDDLSMRTVQLLVAACPNLTVLSELESWEGISSDELIDFKEFIRKNNFDLDVSPTLSFNSYLS